MLARSVATIILEWRILTLVHHNEHVLPVIFQFSASEPEFKLRRRDAVVACAVAPYFQEFTRSVMIHCRDLSFSC